MSRHFRDIAWLVAACLVPAGCAGTTITDPGGDRSEDVAIDGGGATPADKPTWEDDWGEDWLPGSTGMAGAAPAPQPAEQTIEWSIALETFTGPGHEHKAATMLRDLPKVSAKLAGAHVQTKSDGSTVVYGRYDDPTDPQAQRDLAWIKEIEIRGLPVFPRAMLTRFRSEAPPAALHPHDLRNARLRFPKVDPLYTMDVAVWGDFDAGVLDLEEIHRAAEAYCMKLRSQGYDAYFLHDDDMRLSIVTVGLFDRRAIDMRSGFYSPEVSALFRRFPARLYNGEPLNELKDPERPHRGTRVQTPRLVLVPD